MWFKTSKESAFHSVANVVFLAVIFTVLELSNEYLCLSMCAFIKVPWGLPVWSTIEIDANLAGFYLKFLFVVDWQVKLYYVIVPGWSLHGMVEIVCYPHTFSLKVMPLNYVTGSTYGGFRVLVSAIWIHSGYVFEFAGNIKLRDPPKNRFC